MQGIAAWLPDYNILLWTGEKNLFAIQKANFVEIQSSRFW